MEPPIVPEGELNPNGYYQSSAELTHAWDGNPGGLNRGQALYYGYVTRQRFQQFIAQERFQKTWLRRLGRLFVLSLIVSGAINIFLIEGENKSLPYTGHSSTHVRIAAHMMKANPELMAALGPFIVDYPESLFVSQFRNGRAGLVFAVIGTRARGVVTIELFRAHRFASEWRVIDFTVDLLDGTVIEVLPIGSVFTSKAHKARITETSQTYALTLPNELATAELLRKKVEIVENYEQKQRDAQMQMAATERALTSAQHMKMMGVRLDALNSVDNLDKLSKTLFGIVDDSKIQK